MLEEIAFKQVNPMVLFSDNQSAIKLVHNPKFHKRTKHIDIQYHYVREQQEFKKVVKVSYISTHNQIANIFTNALSTEKFKSFQELLGLSPWIQ